MGGSDLAGLTLKAVEALDLLEEDFETIVVLGPGFCHHEAMDDLLTKTRHHFNVGQDVTDLPGLMAQTDLAVASFGVTAYELAAMGVLSVYLCLTQDHVESAIAFVNAGMGVCLGEYGRVSKASLARKAGELLTDISLRESMAKQSRERVDGLGVKRIAQVVRERLDAGMERRGRAD